MNSSKNNTSPPSSLGLQQSAHGLKISRRQAIALSAMGMSMGMLSACGGGDDPSAVAVSPAPEMPIPPVKPLIALQPGVALFVGDGGGQGNTDSPLRLDNPSAIVQDAAGNLYISEPQRHCIRKISPQGAISVFAGSTTGVAGNSNGTGTDALFQQPRGLAIVGNTLYIAAVSNNAIRAADLSTAVVTTVATVPSPLGLATDGTNLFASSFVHTVNLINLGTGGVTVIAGADGSRGRADSPSERFAATSGMAWSAVNNTLYVVDIDNNRICAIVDPLGPGRNTSTFAGSSPADSSFAQSGTADGQGTAARFTQPWGLALAANGTLLVTSYAGRSIRAIATTGANAGLVTTIAGSVTSGSSDGDGTVARFTALEFASIDNNGALLAIDAAGRTVRRVSSSDGFSTAANAAVTTPYGIASQTGTLDASGTNARFNEPLGVVADAQGNLYVTDARAHVVRKITPSGAVTTLAGLANTSGSLEGTGSSARFRTPRGICLDAQGDLLVADSNNHAIRRISLASNTLGEVSTVAGSLGTSGTADSAAGGAISTARFNTPYGVAFDRSSQAIYVADYQNQTIRRIAADGSTLTIGRAGIRGNANTPALFNFPTGVACDSSGNVYVADSTNHLIRKITPTQVVSTLAGSSRGSLDGNGSAAQFNTPFGIAMDAANNLIVAEPGNHTLRRVSTTGATPGDVTTVAGTFGINGGPLAGASLSLPGTLSSPSGVAVVPISGNFSGVSALYAITSRAGVVVVGLA